MTSTSGQTWPRKWLVSAGASAAVFVLTVGAQWFVYIFLLGEAGIRVIGPLVASIAAGLAVFEVQQLAEQRKNSDLQRFRVIAEANHHIRNALQVLIFQQQPADQKSAELAREAVRRIEWVLTEVLPGAGGKPGALDTPHK